MLEICMAVVAAFVVFMVGLPLLGFVAGALLRTLFPYGAGAAAVYGVMAASLDAPLVLPATLLATAVWVAGVLMVRSTLRRRHGLVCSWGEGHYRAAVTILSCGLLKRTLFPSGEWRGAFAEDDEWEWREA